MRTLESIFKSKSTLLNAQRTEEMMANLGANTLLEALLLGTSFSKEKAKTTLERKDELLTYMEGFETSGEWEANGQDEGGWKQFGIYNTGECRFMYIRSEFVCYLRNYFPKMYKQLSNPDITAKMLRKISLIENSIDYPNITWAIKALACAKDIDFRGIQSATTPIRRVTNLIFPEEDTDQFSHTILCERLSETLDIHPMTINTILYNLGQK